VAVRRRQIDDFYKFVKSLTEKTRLNYNERSIYQFERFVPFTGYFVIIVA